VTTLVNTGGDALERYVYSPYGVLTIYDATWANVRSASSYANAYTYTGRQLDTETGLFYYRARFYAAQLGRFLARDMLCHVERTNLYAAHFVPCSLDPLGNDSLADLQKEYDRLGELLKKTTDLARRKELQQARAEILRQMKILKESARIKIKLRNREGRGTGGRRGGGQARRGCAKTGLIKWLFIVECEAACAVWYDGCLDKADTAFDECLEGVGADPVIAMEQIALCKKIVYLDYAECATKYTACGLGCLVPFADLQPK
jgi:RHS repeat-associated protein